ncbi:MAG: hypothetical protein AAFV93_19135, partial [Chloroflexota bacterium]
YYRNLGFDSNHTIFSKKIVPFEPIIDDEREDSEPLRKMFKVSTEHLRDYFKNTQFIIESPFIISPSYQKLVHVNPIREFWHKFNMMGSFQKRMGIIGFSLPDHDEYIRQTLYSIARNFQYFDAGWEKSSLKIVDYKQDEDSMNSYKNTYSFLDWEQTQIYFDGLDYSAIKMLFT